ASFGRPDFKEGVAHFFFSSGGRHTSFSRDWSSAVCSSDLCVESDASVIITALNLPVPPSSTTREAVVCASDGVAHAIAKNAIKRSEERRVGTERGSRWWPGQEREQVGECSGQRPMRRVPRW